MRSRRARPLLYVLMLLAAGCSDDGGPTPSPPPLTIAVPNPVEGRLVTCAECQAPTVTVILEFPVTIGDPAGAGGTLEQLETIVVNATRGEEIARNVRPNTSFAFPSTSVPAGGTLTVEAGVGFAIPPPRDDVRVTVRARLTDGRSASASVPLVVLSGAST